MYWEGLEEETKWMMDERKKEMLEWIRMKGCRKKSLSVYLHGTGEDCLSQRDGEICDNCEKILNDGLDWKVVGKRGQKRGRELEYMEVMEGVELKEMMNELKGSCTLCWLKTGEIVKAHELHRCRWV